MPHIITEKKIEQKNRIEKNILSNEKLKKEKKALKKKALKNKPSSDTCQQTYIYLSLFLKKISPLLNTLAPLSITSNLEFTFRKPSILKNKLFSSFLIIKFDKLNI